MAAPEQLDLLDWLAAQVATSGAASSPVAQDVLHSCDDQAQAELPPVLLTRVDASRNMRRFYGLGLVRSLWGEVGLARQWGRIGSQGQRRTDWHESAGSAAAELQRLAQTKQRKGYR